MLGAMSRRRRDPAPPSSRPRSGPVVRTLPNGVTLVREPDAKGDVRELKGHGFLTLWPVTLHTPDGRVFRSTDWDLSRVVPPPGALRADPLLQTFCCGGPKLWYEDIERRCVQCGEDFVFEAAEQRFWYETLSFHESSTAIRCRKCRKRRRSLHALHNQLALALRATEAAPKDADAWLELARVSAELRAQSGKGDIDRGISAARKAWLLSEERLPEALYWESVLQIIAGREERGLQLEDAFLAAAGPGRRIAELTRSIQDRRSGRAR